MNIVNEIRQRGHGQRVAVRGEGVEITFDDLFAAVDEIREILLEMKCFRRGGVPRVGVRFPNGPGYIVVALAVLDAGGCFVPIPDELADAERGALIATCAFDCLVMADDAGIALPLGLGGVVIHSLTPERPSFPVAEFEALDPAFIRFSSGTTGASKGVILSHESLLERIVAANAGLGLVAGDRVLWTLPMAHHFAVTIILYLYHGVATVLESSHEPEAVFRAARASGANLLYGSPFHFARLAQCAEAGPLPELRMAISTASALNAEVAAAFEKRFEIPVTQAFGIIEVGLPLLNRLRARDLPTALGQPLPGYEVKASEDGELLLKGPGMFDAYLCPWQPRAEVLEDGWFATGDLAEVMEDGTVVMHGRRKSVINIGGLKVFPEEIEAVLNQYSAIRISRAYAGSHPTLGAYPCAEVVLEVGHEMPKPAALKAFCTGKLAAYKIPMRIESVESIALTASGKVKRI
ncbi:MAG: class I adenylate-forming enzyme family protein [Luteolibacter sp.]